MVCQPLAHGPVPPWRQRAITIPLCSMPPPRPTAPAVLPAVEAALRTAHQVLAAEAQALGHVALHLPQGFADVYQLLSGCSARIVVTGVGKSGHIARKCAATLASVGAPAFFLHPSEAVHGDLGMVGIHDVVLALSYSGESREVVAVGAALGALNVPLCVLTGQAESTLAHLATACCVMGPLEEACPLGRAPTVSTTVMLALCDAWAMALFSRHEAPLEIYAARHPAGALGVGLMPVSTWMRTGARLPLVPLGANVARTLACINETPGRPGAAVVVAPGGQLAGLFTDGDLRRSVAQKAFSLEAPIAAWMHARPITVNHDACVKDAVILMRAHGIDQIVVVDCGQVPQGLLDIQDVLPRS